jgi:IS4 transposase
LGWLDSLSFEAGVFYPMDRGYMDFTRLILIASAGAFFVTRAKSNLQFTRHCSKPVDRFTSMRSDHVGKPTLPKSRKAFPVLLRKVKYHDAETSKELISLTNNLEIPALTAAMLYKARWSIEWFFRWIKGHLRIKH